MRLDKYLVDCGVGSRSEIKKLIKRGEVTISGTETVKPETRIDEEKVTVYVKGTEIKYRKHVYFMLNKPAGYVSATRDLKKPVVIDLVPEKYKFYNLFPVGRLDIDTEGLCLITNDGGMAHRILRPSNHIPKTYYALIQGAVGEDDDKEIKKGVVLDDGYKTKPAALEIIRSGENSEVKITITEGKFHQIKRMFEALGKRVIYLKRIAINGLVLDDNLKPGEIRELSKREIELLEKGDRIDS